MNDQKTALAFGQLTFVFGDVEWHLLTVIGDDGYVKVIGTAANGRTFSDKPTRMIPSSSIEDAITHFQNEYLEKIGGKLPRPVATRIVVADDAGAAATGGVVGSLVGGGS